MTFVRSIIHQWNKAQLGHSLQLSLQSCEQVKQLFGGATELSTVANVIVALVYSEGEPQWLTKVQHNLETPLNERLVLNCLFTSSHLLFMKVTQNLELSQAERLVFTLVKTWVLNHDMTQESNEICNVIIKVCCQVDALASKKRSQLKNMC
ncbi:hypothetical protein K0I73_04065 [Shewanella mesophila]|uniref:hypothetical protein n=1 Tax=Shewanella mesophila TaxID=2864208 RepID=UPI001C65AC01|nr:hypothetical protein [Shewanella mesophila]QYJ86921.1 hypothetical protein K0I73_04065 [Shewanella mesophila]